MNQELLKIRNRMNKKKPAFVRKDTYIKAKVKANWRKPRGKHSPVREQHKGRPKLVSPGYGSPKAVRNLHPSGLEVVVVNNQAELEQINPEKQGILISKTVGKKRKIDILKLALEKKLTVLNSKEPQKLLETLEAEFKKRQDSKKKKLTEKEKKEEEKKKKAAEKDKADKKESEEKVEAPESTVKEKKEETKKAEKTEPKTEEEKEKAEKKKIEKTLIKKQ